MSPMRRRHPMQPFFLSRVHPKHWHFQGNLLRAGGPDFDRMSNSTSTGGMGNGVAGADDPVRERRRHLE